MARLEERNYTYFTTLRGMCPACRSIVPARVFFQDNGVFQQPLCPTCETQPSRIAADQGWYMRQVLKSHQDSAPLDGSTPPEQGCPHDCGPCSWHASHCMYATVPVTRPAESPGMNNFTQPGTVAQTLNWISEHCSNVQRVTLTGDELFHHPRGEAILQHAGKTDLDICVTHMIDSHDSESRLLEKIGYLAKKGAGSILQYELHQSSDNEAVRQLVDMMQHNDQIVSIEIIPRTIPIDKAVDIICSQLDGHIDTTDFQSPADTHPMCRWTLQLQSGTISVHRPMDEAQFDCSRAILCNNFVVTCPGRMIPACNHRLFHRGEVQS